MFVAAASTNAALTYVEMYETKVIAPEPAGVGANKCVYYVCAKAGDAWVKLPDVTPASIVAAGSIKKLFTGDLTAAVKTYPAFPGSEADYLRAQIARITADTAIAPAGYLVEVEVEEAEEEEAELDPFKDAASMELYREKQLATVADGHQFKDTAMRVAQAGEEFEGHESMDAVMEAAAWVHTARPLLKQGRCSWYPIPKAPKPPPAEGEEEEEAEEEEPAEPEEAAEFGASIEGDATLWEEPEEGTGGAWAFRMCTSNGGGVHGKATVVAVKSTKWPGAVTVAGSGGGHGTAFSGVYFGNGAEYTATAGGAKPFAPPLPADIQSEWTPAPVDPDDEEAVAFTLTEAVDPTVEQEAEEEERRQAVAEGGVDAEEEAEE